MSRCASKAGKANERQPLEAELEATIWGHADIMNLRIRWWKITYGCTQVQDYSRTEAAQDN